MTETTITFFFYKNVKAEINQDFKNILPEHSSG